MQGKGVPTLGQFARKGRNGRLITDERRKIGYDWAVREASLLRRAHRQLASASLTWRSGGPRHLTFLYDLARGRNSTRLTLSPIGGAPITGVTGWVDFLLDGERYLVHGVIEQWIGGRAILVTRNRVELRTKRNRRLDPPSGRMVAVFVPDRAGLGRCCQPILDIGQRAMRVLSSYPLEPGTALRSLKIILRNQVVRECEGTVISRVEVIDPLGRSGFECRVRLRATSRVELDDDPADLYEVTEPARVRSILWALCDLSHPVRLRAGKVSAHGVLEPIKGPRDSVPQLRCRIVGDVPAFAGSVQLECALYGSGYRLFGRVRGQVGHVLMLAPAPVIREWHRRQEERLVLPSELATTFTFRHPVEGIRHERRVADVSVGGIGVRPDAGDEVLWPGLPLEDGKLTLPGVTVTPASAIVRTVSPNRCGIQMGQLSERDSDRLRVELARIAAKPIELHDGNNLDAILRFHESVRLLEPDMLQNLAKALDETRGEWRAAHQHPEGLMRTAFIRWKDGVGATLTLVRAYEASWVLQHSAVASPAVPANPGMLHSLLVRLAIPRPDGEYVCGYIDEEARSQHSVMNAFFTEWSTPEFRGATRFSLYSAPTTRRTSVPPFIQRLRGRRTNIVERAARRLLDSVCVEALGLRHPEIELPKTRAAYARAGLVRSREAWVSLRANRCRAILLREIASPGLCLSSLLSAGMLLPIAEDSLEDGVALCRHFLSAPLPGDPPFRFMLLPDGCSDAPLLAAGLRRIAGCTLYAMHRFGLQEYHRYVASKYGFLHGRLRARTTEAA